MIEIEKEDLILPAIVISIFCFGVFVGIDIKEELMKKEAAKAKVAEYYIDKDFSKQFRYLKIKDFKNGK